MAKAGFFVALFFLLCSAWAAEETVTFDSPEQKALYHSLLKEYRCLKCQNQNLADSNAGLAGDLRREIREQILAGNNKQHIDSYLIARYGDFVLYRPPFNAKTAVLWIAPFVLLILALVSVIIMITRQRKKTGQERYSHAGAAVADIERLEKAKRLLRNE